MEEGGKDTMEQEKWEEDTPYSKRGKLRGGMRKELA
jgi:hypothetical protein